MFAGHVGTEVVATTLADVGPRIATSVTRDEKQHKLFIKVVNGSPDAQRFSINLDGLSSVKREAALTTLSAKSPNATNSILDPDNIVPVENKIQITGPKFEQSFQPYSVNVLDLSY